VLSDVYVSFKTMKLKALENDYLRKQQI